MKNTIYIILFLFCHLVTFGQLVIPPDCHHSHICCNVGCHCCPEGTITQLPKHLLDSLSANNTFHIPNDSIIFTEKHTAILPDYSKTIYPENDGLIYNQYVGESIAGFYPANGWRIDTINGGFNKEIYSNPYISTKGFEKQDGREMVVYRYENGKLYNGRVSEILTIRFTSEKIAGYLPNGQSYYETKDITIEFNADCVDGLLQGRSVLLGNVPQYGLYNKLPLSECYFEDGEIVGVCKYWDLNSVDFSIQNGNIYSNEEKQDYFAFCKLLELSEITYAKGSSDYIKHTIYKKNKKTGQVKEIEKKIPKKIRTTNR